MPSDIYIFKFQCTSLSLSLFLCLSHSLSCVFCSAHSLSLSFMNREIVEWQTISTIICMCVRFVVKYKEEEKKCLQDSYNAMQTFSKKQKELNGARDRNEFDYIVQNVNMLCSIITRHWANVFQLKQSHHQNLHIECYEFQQIEWDSLRYIHTHIYI